MSQNCLWSQIEHVSWGSHSGLKWTCPVGQCICSIHKRTRQSNCTVSSEQLQQIKHQIKSMALQGTLLIFPRLHCITSVLLCTTQLEKDPIIKIDDLNTIHLQGRSEWEPLEEHLYSGQPRSGTGIELTPVQYPTIRLSQLQPAQPS